MRTNNRRLSESDDSDKYVWFPDNGDSKEFWEFVHNVAIETFSEIHYDRWERKYNIDPSLEHNLMNYSRPKRLILYRDYRIDECLREAIPFGTYLSWLNNDPGLEYIPNDYLSAIQYERLVEVHELDPETRTLKVPAGNYHCLVFPSIVIAFPILGKLLEHDYNYYAKNGKDTSKRTTVYYSHTDYVNGISIGGGPNMFLALSNKEAFSKLKSIEPSHAKQIVMRCFNPNHPYLPDNVLNALSENEPTKLAVMSEWIERWFKYNPNKPFVDRDGKTWIDPTVLRRHVKTFVDQHIPYTNIVYDGSLGAYIEERAKSDKSFEARLLEVVNS